MRTICLSYLPTTIIVLWQVQCDSSSYRNKISSGCRILIVLCERTLVCNRYLENKTFQAYYKIGDPTHLYMMVIPLSGVNNTRFHVEITIIDFYCKHYLTKYQYLSHARFWVWESGLRVWLMGCTHERLL